MESNTYAGVPPSTYGVVWSKYEPDRLVTYGQNHVKFWTVSPDPDPKKTGQLTNKNASGVFVNVKTHTVLSACFLPSGVVLSGPCNLLRPYGLLMCIVVACSPYAPIPTLPLSQGTNRGASAHGKAPGWQGRRPVIPWDLPHRYYARYECDVIGRVFTSFFPHLLICIVSHVPVLVNTSGLLEARRLQDVRGCAMSCAGD